MSSEGGSQNIPAKESPSEWLWKKNLCLAQQAYETPFIDSLKKNSLQPESFKYYLYQDLYFLRGYFRACRIAAYFIDNEKAKNDLIKKGGEEEEIYVRQVMSYFEELQHLGFEYKPYSVPMNMETKSYIKFLLKAAKSKETASMFAALTPCSRLYYYLSSTIKEKLSPEDLERNQYKKWIEENANEEAKASVINMESILDELSAKFADESHKIDELYKQGLEHEIRFFAAAIPSEDGRKLCKQVAPGDNVAPLSLGIETLGGLMTKLIPRNTVIPIKISQIFSICQDQQTTIEIEIFEGEKPLTKDCRKLCSLQLPDISLPQSGVPQIEVTFEVEANGILHVTAENKGTKKKRTITNDRGRPSQAQIERMVQDAEEFDHDKEFETYIYDNTSTIDDK